KDESHRPRVQLVNSEGQPRQDIILPRCYRNPPWTLALAHSLGLGVYHKGGLVQHFDDPGLWREIGYRVVQGGLSPGEHVVLERDPSSYPDYFPKLLRPEDAVVVEAFDDSLAQASWIAARIRENLERDELDFDDILIVLPDAYTSKSHSRTIIQALNNQGINGHLAGVNTSQDELFLKNSVAISHVYRAKGNEAPMVY